jgi:hypothetical protein
MANHLKRLALLLALTVAAPISALAAITYTYTGSNFTTSSADWHLPRDLPPGAEEAESARIAAELLTFHLTISVTLPVYLSTGWNTFTFSEISSPGLINSFTTLQNTHTVDNPTISLSMSDGRSSAFGSVGLQGPVQFGDYFGASVLVDANHQIIEWNIGASGPITENTASFNSAGNGDSTGLFMLPAPRGWLNYSASNTTIGMWNVSGSEVSAVPDAPAYATLLAGLGAIGTLARRRRPRAKQSQSPA